MDDYIVRWLDGRGGHERNFRWQGHRAAGFYNTIINDPKTIDADLIAINRNDEDDYEIIKEFTRRDCR